MTLSDDSEQHLLDDEDSSESTRSFTDRVSAGEGPAPLPTRSRFAGVGRRDTRLRTKPSGPATGAGVNALKEMRTELVGFLRRELPTALEPFKAMEERLGTGGREPCRHACSSGRELLSQVADYVFPASKETREDVWGRPHELSRDKSVNRLVAFAQDELGDDLESWEPRAMGQLVCRVAADERRRPP